MRGNGRIFKQKTSRFWWVQFYDGSGRKIRMSATTTSKTEATKFLRQKLAEIDGGNFVGPEQSRITVGDILDFVEADYKANGQDWGSIKYKAHCVRERFGRFKATSVSETAIERFKSDLLAEGKAPATVNRHLALLRRAFRLAYERRLVSRAPHIQLLSEQGNERQGFVERADLDAVVRHLPEEIQDVALLAFLAGWRRGEILKLQWRDVEFDVEGKPTAIRLPGTKTKNKRGRLLPLHGELLEVVGQRMKTRAVSSPGGETQLASNVFHRNGNPIKSFKGAWAAATKAAGLEGLLFHDLRRSSVRNMIRAGVHERVAMQIAGHRTRAIFDRYNIVDERDLQDALVRTETYQKTQTKRRVMPFVDEETA